MEVKGNFDPASEEIANIFLFLASSKSEGVTGQTITI
jgi:NAD(P)-dependent dehydrogenase (short-subunit alcohol dehydrogenase family)